MKTPSMGCVLWTVSITPEILLHTYNMSSTGFTSQICQPSSHHAVAHVTKLPQPCAVKSLSWKATVWPHIVHFIVFNNNNNILKITRRSVFRVSISTTWMKVKCPAQVQSIQMSSFSPFLFGFSACDHQFLSSGFLLGRPVRIQLNPARNFP